MKNLRLLGFLMILASSSLFINCTSDPIQGPPGVPGEDGIDGVDATTDCRACHSLEHREPIELGYSLSTHASRNKVDGRPNCARCHSNEGFIDQMEFGEVNPNGYAIVSPISCSGCHDEHRSFNFEEDGNDFAIRTLDPVTLIVDSEVTLDFTNESNALGQSNLCINCHQPRTEMPEDDGSGFFEIKSGYWGTHHSPQSVMLEGIQGVLLPGSLSYPARASSTHRKESSCVNCHMSESSLATTGDHTFFPTQDACIVCHEGSTTFDINGFQTEVDDQLIVLAGLLAQVQGVGPDGAPVTGIVIDDDPVLGTFPIDAAGAAWNYIYISEDQSRGVHNPAMVEALLQNSIETLQNE